MMVQPEPLRATDASGGPDLGALFGCPVDALAPVTQLVERVVESYAGNGLLAEMLIEHHETGGKLTRARLALAASLALGAEVADGVPWAAACELLHNATLVHDDIQDGDQVRRGRPALWVTHGIGQAINAGDAMLLLPMGALELAEGYTDGLRWRLAACLTRRAVSTAAGQAAEMALLETVAAAPERAWDAYCDAARGKTGELFALPLEGAALLSGMAPKQARALGDAVTELGVLYQIHDDVRGTFAEHSGRRRGHDLRDGRLNALVAALSTTAPTRLPDVVAALRRPRSLSWDEVADLSHELYESGALELATRRGREIADRLAASTTLQQTANLHEIVTRLCRLLSDGLARTRSERCG